MKKRLLVGVIITDCHIAFQEEILRGVVSQAFKSDCDLAIIAPLHNFYIGSAHKDTEKLVFDLLLSDRFDGFLYDRNSFYGEEICARIDEFLTISGKPVMLLDSPDHKLFDSTSVDDCNAFETITDHLIDVHGLKRIYCLTGPKKSFIAEERLKGFLNSMKKHGLRVDKNAKNYGDFWIDASKAFAQKIVDGSVPRPEAVVCGNDIAAISLCKALAAGGIRVPEDIAVTGYDASVEAASAEPSVTSYARPNFQLGSESFRRLYRIITGRICAKVPNENGSITIGRSCGCEPPKPRGEKRRDAVNASFENNLLYGDMLFDITNADSPAAFSDKLDNYTYLLYKMSRLRVCLTKKYVDSAKGAYGDKLDFRCGDEIKTVLSKNAIRRAYDGGEYFSSSDLLPDYGEDRKYPVAFYISPLHYNDNFFGYSAVSFGKNPIAFGSLYLKWINYVNVALELVRVKGAMSHAILSTNRALLYDKATGMLNRNGVEREFSDRIGSLQPDAPVEYVAVDLYGVKNVYYRSGEEKCNQISASFAELLKSCALPGEICGMWNSQTMCLVSFESGRAESLYGELSLKLKEMRFAGEDGFGVDFSVGVYRQTADEAGDLGEAMYKATVNKVYSYAVSESNDNPQFEKLCALRSRIRRNPEYSWNIGDIAESLYLSKSYLQKIYKSFFGKSIIEETIEFRIETAKKLLLEGDLSVTEISRRCGYSSYNYFVRQFRALEGASPSEFRELRGGEKR